ncbi:hypothetical protein BDN70DRAFT_899200 [Pholiota conissans]|uniref:Uncharacterized protein n=1 Tax=Pholiota conissans TaxID=109636 RepID=A0A9P5YT66_9AGAR|nr:hypothetical protein BDN70DRAFT_899200 [Pholiota conissans]
MYPNNSFKNSSYMPLNPDTSRLDFEAQFAVDPVDAFFNGFQELLGSQNGSSKPRLSLPEAQFNTAPESTSASPWQSNLTGYTSPSSHFTHLVQNPSFSHSDRQGSSALLTPRSIGSDGDLPLYDRNNNMNASFNISQSGHNIPFMDGYSCRMSIPVHSTTRSRRLAPIHHRYIQSPAPQFMITPPEVFHPNAFFGMTPGPIQNQRYITHTTPPSMTPYTNITHYDQVPFVGLQTHTTDFSGFYVPPTEIDDLNWTREEEAVALEGLKRYEGSHNSLWDEQLPAFQRDGLLTVSRDINLTKGTTKTQLANRNRGQETCRMGFDLKAEAHKVKSFTTKSPEYSYNHRCSIPENESSIGTSTQGPNGQQGPVNGQQRVTQDIKFISSLNPNEFIPIGASPTVDQTSSPYPHPFIEDLPTPFDPLSHSPSFSSASKSSPSTFTFVLVQSPRVRSVSFDKEDKMLEQMRTYRIIEPGPMTVNPPSRDVVLMG